MTLPSDSGLEYYHRLRKLTSAPDSGPPRAHGAPPRYFGLHQQVTAEPPHAHAAERDRVAHAREVQSLDRGRACADHYRRDEEGYPIDDTGTKRRAGQLRATLDQHVAPSAPPQLTHHGAQIKLSASRTTAHRASDYFDARAVTPPRARNVRRGRHQQRGRGGALDENPRARGASQAPVNYDSRRVASAGHPAGQARIVGQNGSRADHYRVRFAAPAMHQCARGRRTYPLRIARGGGYSSVERKRELERRQRPPARHASDETKVQAAAFVLQHTGDYFDSRGTQNCQPASAHRRIRIYASDHHASNSGLDQCPRAWRGAAPMRAR